MRNFLLKVLEKLYIKLLDPTTIATIPEALQIVPITRFQVFKYGMNEEQVKNRIVALMDKDLINYVTFERKEQPEGTVLIRGRLDVVKREQHEE